MVNLQYVPVGVTQILVLNTKLYSIMCTTHVNNIEIKKEISKINKSYS